MQDDLPPQGPRSLRTGVPCVVATLLLFGLSSALRAIIPAARLALGKEIPESYTEGWDSILDFGELLWIPLLPATAWGFWLFRKSSRSGVLTWFLWLTIVFSAVHVSLITAIYSRLVFESYEYHERN